MFGGGFNFSNVTLKGLPPGTTGLANNGLSIDPVTGNYVLGNDVGSALATLLSNRAIDLNSFNVFFFGRDNGSGQLNLVAIQDGDIQINNDSSVFGASKLTLFDNADSTLASLAYGNDELRCQALSFRFVTFDTFFLDQNIDAPLPITFNAGNIFAGGSGVGVLINTIWNNAGTPTLFKLTVTDIVSNAASLLQDFQVNGVSKFRIDKSGNIFIVSVTASLNFPNTLTLTSSDLTIAYPGAAVGDIVLLGTPVAAVNANSCYTAFVSAANVITVRFNNYSALPIDPAAGNFTVSIFKQA